MPLLTRFSACLFLMLMLLGCGKEEEATPTNSITLVTMTPAAGAKVSRSSTISATVNYTLAADEASEFGYRVSIQFESAFNGTFALNPSHVTVTDRKGTIQMNYPLAGVWDLYNSRELQHPVTCYFYLDRMTDDGRSTVIAKTQALTFTE